MLREVVTHPDRERQSAPRLLDGIGPALLVAVWFGLAAGLLEAIAATLLKGAPGFAVRVSPEILWVAPALNLSLFLLITAGLLALLGLAGRTTDAKFLAGMFSGATLFSLLLLLGIMHQVAALILSLGVAVQTARSLRGREGRAIKLFRRSVAYLIAIAVFLAAGGAIWNGWRESRSIAKLPPSRAGAPNLLLITLDTLRADHLPSYGYERHTGPNIDRLAEGGALFESAFSTSSWTLPAHASMFTGRLPSEHKADWTEPLDGRYPTLAEALAAQGYRTGAFSANTSYVAPEWGLARGFSRFEAYGNSIVADAATTIYGKKLAVNLLPRLGYNDIPGRKRASEVNRQLLDWLSQSDSQPFFAFLNYFDLHDPYLTVAPYETQFSEKVTRGELINFQFQAGSFRRKPVLTPEEIQTEIDSYDGCLAYLDAQLGELLAELARRGMDKNTLVVVTSDHGEAFGNHDLFGHGNSLYVETLHVPLIFYWPGKISPGARHSQIVSLDQIPSTVMGLMDESSSMSFPGESLAGLLTGKSDKITADAVVSEVSPGRFKASAPNYPSTGGGLKSVLTGEWHLIICESGRTELYRWRNDRQEADNRADEPEAHDIIEQLKRYLEAD